MDDDFMPTPDLNQIAVRSLRGGLNVVDPPSQLMDDQLTESINTDFSESTLGATRRGCYTIPAPAATHSGLGCGLFRRQPDGDPANDTLVSLINDHLSANTLAREWDGTAWSSLTFTDQPNPLSELGQFSAQNLHGKMFLAYPPAGGGPNRLHVMDAGDTNFRRVGLATPAAPTAADTGVGTYPAVLRYYRVRYTVQSVGVTIRRSEPSPSQSFTPSGGGTAARVTKPAAISEGETHWELEASTDNITFYRIATTVVGTTTYDDSASTSTYSTNPLSADVGDYTAPWAAKFLTADQDRLLIAGSWVTTEYASRVAWTPVYASDGVGNDERIELDRFPFLDLDNFDGGGVTGMSSPTNGSIYVFKAKRIYKLIRTGDVNRAYDVVPISKNVGALAGSISSGVDAYGNPCVYFWDPDLGPQRIGPRGLEDCGRDVRQLVTFLNPSFATPVQSLYYPARDQMWWWVSTTFSNVPDRLFVFQIRDGRNTEEGVVGGWHEYTGPMTQTLGACMFRNYADLVARHERPFLLLYADITSEVPYVQADTFGLDRGDVFTSYVTTKAFMPAGLLRKIGAMAGTVLALGLAGWSAALKLVRDYGLETKTLFASFSPTVAHETRVFAPLDDAALSELRTLQMTIQSADPSDATFTGAIEGQASPVGSAYADAPVGIALPQHPFAIGVWLYATSSAGTQTGVFRGRDNAGGFGVGISGGNWAGFFANGFGSTNVIDTGVAVTLNTWTLVVLRGDVGVQQMYVNGVAQGTPGAFLGSPDPANFSILSRLNEAQTAQIDPFVGRAAHAFFLDARNINAEEMLALYNGGPSSEALAPFLIGTPLSYTEIGGEQKPWNVIYFPLQSADDMTDFNKYYTLTPANIATAAGPSVIAAPAPYEIDMLAVQIRLEESQ